VAAVGCKRNNGAPRNFALIDSITSWSGTGAGIE
jgi:hypothetical protein